MPRRWYEPVHLKWHDSCHPKYQSESAWKICKHYDDYGILWIYDDLYDDIDASDFLNGLEELPKKSSSKKSQAI